MLNGKGASLLDGYMEDLATDRIYRLMIAQRHAGTMRRVAIADDAATPINHTPELVTRLFDEELARILRQRGTMKDVGTAATFRQARTISEAMILGGAFDPL